jgi:hypothetical protein
VSLAWGAGRALPIPAEELNEALRRAVVVRAVGGSPEREVSLDEDAVERLAEELDSAERRFALLHELDSLRDGLGRGASESLDALLADGALAWRCFAAGLLAAELA